LGFHFTVEYKPGRQNIVTDALSRRDVPTGHACAVTGTSFDLFAALRHAAHTDPTLVTFREQLESGKLGQPWAPVDGIVTFQQRAYVPPSSQLVAEVLAMAHDDGHEGIQKSLHRLRRDFHLPQALSALLCLYGLSMQQDEAASSGWPLTATISCMGRHLHGFQ
jgi:hypothetical protein